MGEETRGVGLVCPARAQNRGDGGPGRDYNARVKRREPAIRARGTGAPGRLLFLFSSFFFLWAPLAGCEDEPPRPSAAPPGPPPPTATAAPEPPASAAAPTASAAASAPAPTAGIAASAPALQGTWEGTYDAKKGTVELPAKVKDKARQKDDGKVATGPGTITFSIEPGGELRGKAKGALGDATLIGRVEGDVLRASVTPDDPLAPQAMTGILVGKLEGTVIRANLRVAGPDAVLVRESAVELKQK